VNVPLWALPCSIISVVPARSAHFYRIATVALAALLSVSTPGWALQEELQNDRGAVPAPDGGDTPVPTPDGSGTPEPVPEGGGDEGSLRADIPRQVGESTLVDAQSMPEAIPFGATDAVICIYVSPSGLGVFYQMIALLSVEAARNAMKWLIDPLLMQGYQVETSLELRDSRGRRIGQMLRLVGPLEHIYWTNGNVLFAVDGPLGEPTKFLAAYGRLVAPAGD
jgi:hypothetical protein